MGSDPEADDDQLEACRLADSALAEQLAAVEDDALRLHRLEHGLDESGDVGLDSVDTSSPLRALAGLGAKSRGLGSNQLARLSDRLDKAVGAASTSTMTSPTLGCVLAAPGGNFAPAPGAGGAFMGPDVSTHSAPAAELATFNAMPALAASTLAHTSTACDRREIHWHGRAQLLRGRDRDSEERRRRRHRGHGSEAW